MQSERLLLRDARPLTFDASSFKMAEILIQERTITYGKPLQLG